MTLARQLDPPWAAERHAGVAMRAPAASDIAAGEVLLSVENVSLSFGGVKAISDVSFDIRKGEIRAIIGPNGAGKTSMLNVINGFYSRSRAASPSRARRAARCGRTTPPRRHRPHVPERRAVPRHDARSTTSWPAARCKMHRGLLLAVAALRPGADRGDRAPPAASRRSSTFSRSRRSARCRWRGCLTACRSASSLAARSPWSRTCCCSTSRWPA